MEKLVAEFPKQIADALEIAENTIYSSISNKSFDQVVVCGMGGSGIGGKITEKLFLNEIKIPVVLVQNYDIPAFVSEKTLFIASSYSGSTEETLAAVGEAKKRKSTIIGICSGGELMQFCKKNNYDFVKIPGGNPPRSMLAFSLIQLIDIFTKAGFVSKTSMQSVGKARNFLSDELMQIKKQAKVLAQHLYQKQGVLYGNAELEGIIIRARQQFNENSKQLVYHHIIPEMNHNELVGWEGGNDQFAAVFFESQFTSKRNILRFQLSKEIIEPKTSNILFIKGVGKDNILEMFYLVHLVDWASIYLADLNKKDTIDIKSIVFLKSELEKR